MKRPNVVFVFGDEWRAQATGYAGGPNCETPVIDELAAESINFTTAIAGCSVCCPYRASLLTGQYPLRHGVVINDVELDPASYSIARAFGDGGYNTAYIGKWHVYGSPDGKYGRRQAYVPREYQLGFDYWKGFECTHDYNDSCYYFNDDPTKRRWDGYDAFAQSDDAAQYIRDHADDEKPFMLMLSWGPPHFPLHTAPEAYRERYRDRPIELRPNVPDEDREQATENLRGYYAHIAALDDCMKTVWDAVRTAGIEEDTIVIFTSDHGDMMQSQGLGTKLFPFDESIRVPFLLHYPRLQQGKAWELHVPIDAPDIMPTLLGLVDLPVPPSVEGTDWSPWIRGENEPTGEEAGLLTIPIEFTEIVRNRMKAYRGLRTPRYTYVRDSEGPWLLFDNEADPYQMKNLIGRPEASDLQDTLEHQLQDKLDALGDEFLDGQTYIEAYDVGHYMETRSPKARDWKYPWDAVDQDRWRA